jgi:3-oxoacyl-[acyl-carrier protein] reductase
MAPSAVEAVQSSNGSLPAEPVVQSAKFPTLAGKVALITGSGRGIGKGMALELASRGASVVINYAKSADKAQEVVKEIIKGGTKAIALQADVSKPEEIFRLFEQAHAHFGRLDIVISNSGTEVWSKEEDVTQADFDYIFNINCRGQFFVAQQGLKYLGQGGRIILMSSIAAQMSGIPNRKPQSYPNTKISYLEQHPEHFFIARPCLENEDLLMTNSDCNSFAYPISNPHL